MAEPLVHDYSHIDFVATSPKALRRALLAAAKADHAIDIAREDLDPDPAVVRHTVTVNGRRIGYAARLVGKHYRLTALRNFDFVPRYGAMPAKYTKNDAWLLDFKR